MWICVGGLSFKKLDGFALDVGWLSGNVTHAAMLT